MGRLPKALGLTALIASAGAVVTGCTADYRATQAEELAPPVGEFITVDGAKVHYVQTGEGPDIVLLHGAGGNLRDFTFDLVDLLKDDYRVTAFDRPGLGYSDRLPGIDDGPFATEGESPQAQALHLRTAAEQLGVTDPIIAGHSFGGIVALAWALAGLDGDHPADASAIVSFAGVAMPWEGGLGSYYTINGSAAGAVTIPVISAVASEDQVNDAIANTFAPQPAAEGYADHLGGRLAVRPTHFRANIRQVNTLYDRVVEMVPDYPRLTLPIEILHGTADETVPITVHANEIEKIVPSVNVTPLEGVGHMPHHVDTDAALAAIRRAATRAGLR